jgi:hypothetical protein
LNWRLKQEGVLKRTSGLKKEEVTGGRRKLDEFHNFYSSSNIIRVVKSRLIGWARQKAGMAEAYTTFSLEYLELAT